MPLAQGVLILLFSLCFFFILFRIFQICFGGFNNLLVLFAPQNIYYSFYTEKQHKKRKNRVIAHLRETDPLSIMKAETIKPKGAMKMELTYTMQGDYLIPDLTVPESPKIGKYGMLRRTFLREHRDGIYTGMLLEGTLNSH